MSLNFRGMHGVLAAPCTPVNNLILRSPSRPHRPLLQAWSTILEGIRLNGADITITPGLYRTDSQHVAVLDSGAPSIYVPRQIFQAAAQQVHGFSTVHSYREGDKIFFDCEVPQLLELKLHGRWFPLDPLDMLMAGSRQLVNGTEL
jgi:hypothetical protein